MAQEVKIRGATYSDVPSISVPDSNGTYHSFVDTSDADATASEILAGATRYVNGSKLTGAISPSTPVSSTISSKDTVITVPRGYYTGSSTVQIANAEQSKIIANNIRSGVTILGIGGSTNVVNTGDANATRADIISGKTRYVAGVKITGTGSGGDMSFSKVNSLPSSPDSTTFYLIGDSNWSATGDITLEDIVFTSSLPSSPNSNTIYVLI